MTPRPAPADGIALAWELRRERKSLEQVRQGLLAEGFKCDSLDTVSRWCKLGAQAEEYIKVMEDDSIEEWHGLDRTQQRWILASGLDKVISKWWDAIETAGGHPKILDIASTHMKWAFEFRARLTNDWAPPHPNQMQVSGQVETPRPSDEVLEAVAKTMERQQQTVEQYRNGGNRGQT
jgi:hypothetical protein